MKRACIRLGVVGLVTLLALTWVRPLVARAQSGEPDLLIASFKVTSSNGQFVEIYNNTDQPIDMAGVQLAYYNNFDIAKSTSSKLIGLSGTLPAHGYYLVNDSAATLCYQTVVASASLGFSSTAGMVQVHRLSQPLPGGPITSSVVDVASWSRTAAVGAATLPSYVNAFLQRKWPESIAKTVGGGSWLSVQPSASDPCQLESLVVTQTVQAKSGLLPGTLPPVRFVAAPVASNGPVERNTGKMAPVINELLPNPASPQTDTADEFIELYNPNDSVFDLTDFKLSFGSTSPRSYSFPDGTLLQPKSFTAFTSGDTSISLSNDLAQAWLLDQNGQIISTSEPYQKAKDGQAWALNNGTWTWTLTPTPNEMNAISEPAAPTASKTTAAVLGITTTNNGQSSGNGSPAPGQSAAAELADATPLHPAVLAVVGALAVGYAVYEYRHDMANRVFQFRRYVRNRRALRPEV